MLAVVRYPKVCKPLDEKKKEDYEEKMSTLAQKSLQICFWLAVALTLKCKPDLSPSFCFSALRGPFDSPKGKTCQNLFLLCWCSGLQSSLLLLLLYSCHPSITAPVELSFLSSESWELWRGVVRLSLCTWPLLTSSLDLLIFLLDCSLRPESRTLFNKGLKLFQDFQKGLEAESQVLWVLLRDGYSQPNNTISNQSELKSSTRPSHGIQI